MSRRSDGRPARNRREAKSGAALLVALWVMLVLAILVGSFAYEMRVESEVTTYARNRFKAEFLARAGVEWAKVALTKKTQTGSEGDLLIADDDDEQLAICAANLAKGLPATSIKKEVDTGSFTVDILPEEGRRNVNMLSDEDWEEILDQANIPEEKWPELIDCYTDWVDPGDEHQLNGAESDDSFYKDRGYSCKNAPLDTVDELLMVKGFTPSMLYGGPPEEGEDDAEPYAGFARWLTSYGDGKVNVNTASREVLMTFVGMDEQIVDEILQRRLGVDGQPNSRDDGIKDLGEIPGLTPDVAAKLTTSDRKFIRVIAVGEVNKIKAGVWTILQVSEKNIVPLFWREETLAQEGPASEEGGENPEDEQVVQ